MLIQRLTDCATVSVSVIWDHTGQFKNADMENATSLRPLRDPFSEVWSHWKGQSDILEVSFTTFLHLCISVNEWL